MTEWIPIPQKDTPNEDGTYICTVLENGQRHVEACKYSFGNDWWYNMDGQIVIVVAWQPFPNPYW